MRRRAWAGMIAIGLGVVAAGPVQAGPPKNVPAAAQQAVEEAKRLQAEAEQLYAQGKYVEAIAVVERVLSLQQQALGSEHPDVAASLADLGVLYSETGDYGQAEPLLQRSLAIREKALGSNHPDVADSLEHMGFIYLDKGDYGQAEPLFQRSLAIREKALAPDHPKVALALNNLAGLYHEKGDRGQAEPLYERALAIQEKVLGPDHPKLAVTLQNLAGVYHDKGDDRRAEPLYRRSLSILEKALGPDHPQFAIILDNIAEVYRGNRDDERAEWLYKRALAILEKMFGPDHRDVARTLNNVGMLYAVQGRAGEAVTARARAADIQDRNAAAVLATGSEEQKRLYMATLGPATHATISLHVQHAPADPAAARLALTVVLRRKGRVLDAMTDSVAALRRTLAPGDQALLDQLASLYSKLATQVSRGPSDSSPEQYRTALRELEQQRQTLEEDLGRQSALFRAQQRMVQLSDVQAALPEGAALLEIAVYRPNNPRGAPAIDRWSAPRYVAYVVRRRGEPAFADIGDAAGLDAAVDKLRQALADSNLNHDPKPAARALDALLMQPLRKLLGDVRWVFVSPDGPLSLVPFAALVDEQGRYLVERYLFNYVTSGRELIRFQAEPAPLREVPLLLANPAYDATTATSAPAAAGATHRGVRALDMDLKVLPLQTTSEEARAIARLFPDARVLLGTQATEGAVKAAHGPRVLHLATHGFFLPEQPLPAALSTGGELTAADRRALAQRENPLLRSGIALAGFNQRRSGSDDGVLTALETAGLDLYGTRLVVVSTCESGLGKASRGEGVYGLRRALSMAGAETQVISLWRVDTGRTRELMTAYYDRLHAGAGRSEAMRQVQLAMLADPATAHPNIWASFVVAGDWRTLQGQARLPALGRVSAGPRGCACGQARGHSHAHSEWLLLAVGAVLAARQRHSRRGHVRA